MSVVPVEAGAAALADLALKGALVLVAAGAAALALRRASASARHLAWTLGFAGMLALPVLSVALPAWRIPVLPADPTGAAYPLYPPKVAGRVSTQDAAAAERGTTPASGALARQVELTRDDASAPPARDTAGTMGWMAAAAWLLGAALALARVAASVARVRREERAAHPLVRGPAAEMRDRLVWRLGIDRPVTLLQGPAGAMPLTWGVARPRVLLPAGTEAWPEDRLRAVLTHELAHVRRRDCAWQLLAEAACALHWFNPLAWAAARRLRLESEHACDDQVLLAGSRGADYAGHLLDVARTLAPPRPAVLAGVPMARPSQLRTRLLAVLSADRRRGTVPLRVAAPALAGAAALVAVIAALTPSRAGAAEAAVAPGRCSQPGAGAHTTDLTDGHVWTTSWSNGSGCGGRARIEGDVRFTADRTSVESIAPGGLLRLELLDNGLRTGVEMRPGADGGVSRTFRTGGRAHPWGADADRWLAAALPELLRHTDYAADLDAAARKSDGAAVDAPVLRVEEERILGPRTVPVAGGVAERVDAELAFAPRGGRDTVPADRVDREDATTTLVHQDRADAGARTEYVLLARDVTLEPDRAGFTIAGGGYVVFRENLPDGRVRRVEVRPDRRGNLRHAWAGDFAGTDRDAWMRRMLAHFARSTAPQRRW